MKYRLNAGAYARTFEVYLGEHGIFDDLCGRQDGAVLASELMTAAQEFRGVLGRRFYKAVASRWDEVQAMRSDHWDRVRQSIAKSAHEGELNALNGRLLDGLAFAALIGVIASKLEVLDVKPGTLMNAFRVVFREHLDRTKAATPVAQQVIEEVRHFLQVNQGRFLPFQRAAEATERTGLAGFRKPGGDGDEFLFYPGVFRKEFGRFGDDAYAHLREAGFLKSQASRYNVTTVRMPARNGEERRREGFVIVHASILQAEEAE